MRRSDWMLAQLPVGMVEDSFFVRFVSIFQEVATSLLEGADNIENAVDLTVAPDAMIRWLGSWIGMDPIDPATPDAEQRVRLRSAARTLAWRGTRRGLVDFAELMSGGRAELVDEGGVWAEGTAPAGPPRVVLSVESTGSMTERDFVRLLRDEVPAYVAIEIRVAGRQVWPPLPTAATAPRVLTEARS